MTGMPKRKADRPETMRQARSWESAKNQYRALGLCWSCAGQAAWGHAIGFARSEQPCQTCIPVVATFPSEKANGWRAYPERERRAMTRVVTPAGTGAHHTSPASSARTVTHGKCGKAWTQRGDQTSHCGSCHETFAGLNGFDRHRRDGLCLEPAELVRSDGMKLYELSAEGTWALRQTLAQRAWLRGAAEDAA